MPESKVYYPFVKNKILDQHLTATKRAKIETESGVTIISPISGIIQISKAKMAVEDTESPPGNSFSMIIENEDGVVCVLTPIFTTLSTGDRVKAGQTIGLTATKKTEWLMYENEEILDPFKWADDEHAIYPNGQQIQIKESKNTGTRNKEEKKTDWLPILLGVGLLVLASEDSHDDYEEEYDYQY